MTHLELERVERYAWETPRRGEMRVPGRVFASEELMTEGRARGLRSPQGSDAGLYVVEVMEGAGVSRHVAELRPLGVVKG